MTPQYAEIIETVYPEGLISVDIDGMSSRFII